MTELLEFILDILAYIFISVVCTGSRRLVHLCELFEHSIALYFQQTLFGHIISIM